MNPALLSVFSLSALTMVPVAISEPQQETHDAGTCGVKITELENQVQTAVDSAKVVHFIESNTTAFKSLDQKYTLFWLNTSYKWDADISSCSAKLEGITASFQLSDSTTPFMGVAYITVSPRMDNVTSVQVDVTNHITSHK